MDHPRMLFSLLFAVTTFVPLRFARAEEPAPAAPTATPAAAPTPRKPAQVMGVGGASWLERKNRTEEEPPEIVISSMELKETDVVVDLGCGTGWYTRRIAPMLTKGKVIAVDIQEEMIELLKVKLESEKITNVETIVSEPEDPKLPKGGVDWILLVDVYHEFQNPAPMLKKMREALSPNGRICLVEFRLEGESARQIKIEHRMSVKQVLSEWNPAGFELVDLQEDLPMQHIFIFKARPDCP